MTRDNPSAAKPHAVLGRTQPWQEPVAGCCQTRWWRRRRHPLMGKDRRGKAAAGGRTLRHLGLHTQSQMWPRETGTTQTPRRAQGRGAGSRHTAGGRDGDRASTLLWLDDPCWPRRPTAVPSPSQHPQPPSSTGPMEDTPRADIGRRPKPPSKSHFFFLFFLFSLHSPHTEDLPNTW